MKIEKINDNQIRCTLTRDDLAERELKLSEIAYGTEKAKMLFRDMMQQAASEFGFEADDIPLMIEAIPASADSIVLIITKVDNPDELDSRFSKMSPFGSGDGEKGGSVADRLKKLEGAEGILDLLRHVKDAVSAPAEEMIDTNEQEEEPQEEVAENSSLRFFSFSSLNSAIRASKLLCKMYDGSNSLYKDEPNNIYILVITQSEHTTSDFNRICNMLSEYGCAEDGDGSVLAYLEEHCTTIVAQDAIQTLGKF